jgi:hypothetical protein
VEVLCRDGLLPQSAVGEKVDRFLDARRVVGVLELDGGTRVPAVPERERVKVGAGPPAPAVLFEGLLRGAAFDRSKERRDIQPNRTGDVGDDFVIGGITALHETGHEERPVEPPFRSFVVGKAGRLHRKRRRQAGLGKLSEGCRKPYRNPETGHVVSNPFHGLPVPHAIMLEPFRRIDVRDRLRDHDFNLVAVDPADTFEHRLVPERPVANR